jgi:hypothetical protein
LAKALISLRAGKHDADFQQRIDDSPKNRRDLRPIERGRWLEGRLSDGIIRGSRTFVDSGVLMPIQRSTDSVRDARHQNQLAARLRRATQARAIGPIRDLIARDPKVGLAMANRVLREPPLLTQLFREGLHRSNESTIKFRIEALGPRLGPMQMIDVIQEEALQEPSIAHRTLYWLPAFVKQNSKARERVDELRRRFPA